MPRQIPIYNYFISLHLSEEGEFSYILSSQSELDPASFIDVSLIQAVEQEESSSPFKRMMLHVRFWHGIVSVISEHDFSSSDLQ